MSIRNLAYTFRATATAPLRQAHLRQLCAENNAPLMVPFYHRVADTHLNDWTISRSEFSRHVQHCREQMEPVTLEELQRRVDSGRSPKPTITFTFDDGYAENCEFALPLLVEKQIPTVYFVTTENILHQKPFPHDVEAGVSLPLNTVGQLRQISEMGIEIGLHTRSHLDFSKIYSTDTIRREIIEAKDALEQMIGHAVRYFAFPFGLPRQITQPAIEAVHECGLLGFCSAFGAYNVPGRDSFHIRRFHGDPEFGRFLNWLNYDPGKLDREPPVRYFLPSGVAT